LGLVVLVASTGLMALAVMPEDWPSRETGRVNLRIHPGFSG
jgi:hypothetical protein